MWGHDLFKTSAWLPISLDVESFAQAFVLPLSRVTLLLLLLKITAKDCWRGETVGQA